MSASQRDTARNTQYVGFCYVTTRCRLMVEGILELKVQQQGTHKNTNLFCVCDDDDDDARVVSFLLSVQPILFHVQ
jgi:hypothetical protein